MTNSGSCAQPDGRPPSLSVLILTRNEEANIASCLEHLGFSDDIVVLDSCSTDRTKEIASNFANTRIIERPFDTEYRQRNFGLHAISYRHPWVYVCDADEVVPPELAAELVATANDPAGTHAAYRLRYRNYYMGKWIKHATSYPVWILRLVRPDRVTYEVRETNVHPVVDGTVGELGNHFHHFSFSSGLPRWFDKHNFYSTREAIEGIKVRRRGRPSLRELRNADPMLRRRSLKNLSYFFRHRALYRFMHSYILKGGFLDGLAGFHYCALIAMYEYWIELKIEELERPWGEQTALAANELVSAETT